MSPAPAPVVDRVCTDCREVFPGKYSRWCPNCRWKRRGRRGAQRKYDWTPARDQVLREQYDPRIRGRAAALAAGFGWPKWAINHRAVELGLSRDGCRKAWRPEEIAFVRQHIGRRTTHWIAEQLGRSQTSVVVRIKRLKISRRDAREGYTLRELELAFGTDHHVIERWVREGRLRVARRGSRRRRDTWVATDADIVSFVRTHRAAFRLDKVDQPWFLNLIFGGPLRNGHVRIERAS